MDLKLEKVFSVFLRKNYYYVDEKEVKLQLESHPDYPSLRSVTDTLDYLEIEHVAIQIPTDSYDQLPDCFLAMLNDQGDQKNNLIAAEKKGETVVIHNTDHKDSILLPKFHELWSGVVVAVEPNIAEKDAQGNAFTRLFTGENLLIASGILFSLVYFLSPQPSFFSILFLLLSLIGLTVSVAIIKEELGQGSRFTQRLCNASQATSCQEVLNSSGAKIYRNIGLSDLALIYFSTLSFIVFFGLLSDPFLIVFSVAALPVVVYTLVYQAFVVRKWCTLCLTLSVVLLVQFGLAVLFIRSLPGFDLRAILAPVMTGSLLGLVWFNLKPLIKSNLQGKKYEKDLLRLKKDVRVFETMLRSGKTVEFARNSDDQNIIFGNELAPVRLIAVTNPLCGYCKPAFEQYEKLLRQYPDQVALSMKFNVFLKDAESPGRIIAKRIIEIYSSEGKEKAFSALGYWFTNKDFDQWISEFGRPEQPEDLGVLENHKAWSLKNDINYTPATILGNQIFPEEYKVGDIMHFMEELSPGHSEEPELEKQ